jgi:hypothetical protein
MPTLPNEDVRGLTIVCTFHALCPSDNKKITQYCTILIDLRKKLIGSPEAISAKSLKTHIFSHQPKGFEMIIKIIACKGVHPCMAL